MPRSIRSSAPWIVAAVVLALSALPLLDAAPDQTAPEQDGQAKSAIAAARDFSRAFSSVAQSAGPAVVYLEVEAPAQTRRAVPPGMPRGMPPGIPRGMLPGHPRMQPGLPYGHPPTPPGPRRGQGTGFFISADGLLLTNAHVVKDARRIDVRLQDGRTFRGELVGSDPKSDVALVRVEGKGFPFLRLADSDALEVGEWVVAIGNPFGLRATVTAGIVSAKGRTHVGITDYENFIQTDAAINPGNSGGPMLNLDGEVVGINSAIFSRSGGYMGIGFAIPSNLARSVKDQLLDHGSVVRGYLGVVIQDLTPSLAESFGLDARKGALVAQVAAGSPAAKAGLKPGDILVAVDGKAVAGAGALRLAVGKHRPGTTAAFELLRDGRTQTKRVTLAQRDGQSAAAAALPKTAQALGLTLQPLTKQLAEKLGVIDAEGVLIGSVEPQGPAARAGLRAGALILAVNGDPARDVKQVVEALERAKAAKRPVRLLIRAGEATRFLLLRFD